MSLTSALNNALSGLRTSSAAANLVGTNLSNSLNENYARREATLEQDLITGGVRIVGVARAGNSFVNADWRQTNASVMDGEARLESANKVLSAFGIAGEDGSLEAAITRLETSLISSSSRPDLQQRLNDTAYALRDLVSKVNDVSDRIQTERTRADVTIAQSVERVNAILSDLQVNNSQVISMSTAGNSSASLLDQRDKLLNELSEYAEIRVIPRNSGSIAVYTSGGIGLLDGSAAELEFTQSPSITADMTIDNGLLSGLSVKGQAYSADRMGDGIFAAQFSTRDEAMLSAQADLDAFAFNLASRINDPTLDPTRTATDPGFLTDGTGLVDPADTIGLSARLQLNAAIDLDQGGDPALLRDGLLSTGPTNTGNASLLQGLVSRLGAQESITLGSFSGTTNSLSSLASATTSLIAQQTTRFESALASAQAQKSTLDDLRNSQGVDTDTELQNLLLIEQSYGANAQVIQTIDELMDTLLGIV
ncbi:flagellar hook-associated protein FlgK [Roseobacteraceae bacterium S113]